MPVEVRDGMRVVAFDLRDTGTWEIKKNDHRGCGESPGRMHAGKFWSRRICGEKDLMQMSQGTLNGKTLNTEMGTKQGRLTMRQEGKDGLDSLRGNSTRR